jgi:hypothetical protein
MASMKRTDPDILEAITGVWAAAESAGLRVYYLLMRLAMQEQT